MAATLLHPKHRERRVQGVFRDALLQFHSEVIALQNYDP